MSKSIRKYTEEDIKVATKFWVNKFPSWFSLQPVPIQYELIVAYYEIQEGELQDKQFANQEESTISFTPDEEQKFKLTYTKAIRENKDSFIFKDSEILTSYAKYLIEFLNQR